jgi:N-acetyl-anhydromuramoyl-L-alanine amidase
MIPFKHAHLPQMPMKARVQGSVGPALRIDSATGLAAGVRQVISPNFDARPAGVTPDLIIVHGISLPPREFGGPWIDRLFSGNLPPDAHPFFREVSRSRVSAHALIDRRGNIVQYVPFSLRAWHAGVSEYQGRQSCNDFSIGIELEGVDDAPYEDVQYVHLAALIRALLIAYPSLDRQRVVGHSDVAPGRKTDPGSAFDWARLRALLA